MSEDVRQGLCEQFGAFFANVGSDLAGKVIELNDDEQDDLVIRAYSNVEKCWNKNTHSRDPKPKLELVTVTESEVVDIIMEINHLA